MKALQFLKTKFKLNSSTFESAATERKLLSIVTTHMLRMRLQLPVNTKIAKLPFIIQCEIEKQDVPESGGETCGRLSCCLPWDFSISGLFNKKWTWWHSGLWMLTYFTAVADCVQCARWRSWPVFLLEAHNKKKKKDHLSFTFDLNPAKILFSAVPFKNTQTNATFPNDSFF